MGVDESWTKLLDVLHDIVAQKLYSAADDRLTVAVRDLVLYEDRWPHGRSGLAHYTSWENMLRMLDVEKGQQPMLRMYNYEAANDPQEGRIKPRGWARLERDVGKFIKQYDPEGGEERTRGGSTYGCSFSTNGVDVQDNLMLWRLYGNDGEGCSLKLGSATGGMYKVRYRDQARGGARKDREEDHKVVARVGNLLRVGRNVTDEVPRLERSTVGRSIARMLGRVLDGYSHLVKNKAYEHEREWRVIDVMPDKEVVRYDVGNDRVVRRYVEKGRMRDLFSSGSEITIGPRVANGGAARAYVEMLARKHGMKYTRVTLSARDYR